MESCTLTSHHSRHQSSYYSAQVGITCIDRCLSLQRVEMESKDIPCSSNTTKMQLAWNCHASRIRSDDTNGYGFYGACRDNDIVGKAVSLLLLLWPDTCPIRCQLKFHTQPDRVPAARFDTITSRLQPNPPDILGTVSDWTPARLTARRPGRPWLKAASTRNMASSLVALFNQSCSKRSRNHWTARLSFDRQTRCCALAKEHPMAVVVHAERRQLISNIHYS